MQAKARAFACIRLALAAVFLTAPSCTKKNPVYSGRYLAERTEDGGKTWARDQGGLAARGSTTRADEELSYAKKMFEAGVTLCNQSAVADRTKVRVRGYNLVKGGTEPIRDDELRQITKFDMDCESYLATRK